LSPPSRTDALATSALVFLGTAPAVTCRIGTFFSFSTFALPPFLLLRFLSPRRMLMTLPDAETLPFFCLCPSPVQKMQRGFFYEEHLRSPPLSKKQSSNPFFFPFFFPREDQGVTSVVFFPLRRALRASLALFFFFPPAIES